MLSSTNCGAKVSGENLSIEQGKGVETKVFVKSAKVSESTRQGEAWPTLQCAKLSENTTHSAQTVGRRADPYGSTLGPQGKRWRRVALPQGNPSSRAIKGRGRVPWRSGHNEEGGQLT